MAVLEQTIQQRRARVNVDSLVAFDGVNQYADAGVNPNVTGAIDYDRDFSVGTFLYAYANQLANSKTYNIIAQSDEFSSNNAKGWGLSLRRDSTLNFLLRFNLFQFGGSERVFFDTPHLFSEGVLLYVHLNYLSASQSGEFFVNSQTIATRSLTIGIMDEGVQNQSFPIEFAANRGIGTNADIFSPVSLDQTIVLNRTLTEAEIGYTHRYGGLIPQSTHAACVAHYRTRTSGKVIDDLVEDYNPAKVAAGVPTLTAYPANLINFTDAQVGIPNQNTNTAYLDFYDKTPIIS